MFSQVVARFALAAAIVLAGQAALLHPLTHVDQQGGLVHVPGKDNSPGKLCDVLASLTACVPDAPRAVVFSEPAGLFSIRREAAPRIAEAPPFLSQGPPALL